MKNGKHAIAKNMVCDEPKLSESKLSSILVLFITSIVVCVVFGVGCFVVWPSILHDYSRILFVAYLSVYFSMWLVYFLSKSGACFFRVTTLRRLLLVKSKHWTDADTTENTHIENVSMEKAKTSITAIAMLVAVSFLGMVQAKGFYFYLLTLTQGEHFDNITWYIAILGFAGFSSLSAFICFIISADALDCMFNEFETNKLDSRLRRYFYRSTTHPRYFGLVFLLTSIIFLLAFLNAILGCVAIGLVITIGYRHWFPPVNILDDGWDETAIHSGFLLRVLFFLLPLGVVALCV